MSVEIIAQDSSELTLQIKVNLNGSMLNIENKIQTACNEAGLVSAYSVPSRHMILFLFAR